MALSTFTFKLTPPLPLRRSKPLPNPRMFSLLSTPCPTLCLPPPSRNFLRHRRFLPVNAAAASVNGIPVATNPENQGVEENIDLGERIRKIFKTLLAIFPGGKWRDGDLGLPIVEANIADEREKSKVIEAAEESLEKTKMMMEDSAKTAAEMVGEAVHKTADIMKETFSHHHHHQDEL
uniref:Uncharacterized protein n=1 Tax=Chenopodium quinoa TaxID=63459 RepID=A0A803KQP1_CHEQI